MFDDEANKRWAKWRKHIRNAKTTTATTKNNKNAKQVRYIWYEICLMRMKTIMHICECLYLHRCISFSECDEKQNGNKNWQAHTSGGEMVRKSTFMVEHFGLKLLNRCLTSHFEIQQKNMTYPVLFVFSFMLCAFIHLHNLHYDFSFCIRTILFCLSTRIHEMKQEKTAYQTRSSHSNDLAYNHN